MDLTEIIQESKYRQLKKVGLGTFGVVWKCVSLENHYTFALKIVHLEPTLLKSIATEVLILKDIANHRRLVSFYGSKIEMDCRSILIFTEFMEKGSLRDVMNRSGVFSRQQASRYCRGALEGLEFLHENNVIHRDIKCGNILLDNDDEVKLTDFGLSKCVENKSALGNHSFCGTLNFMAPEIVEKQAYSASVDIWALGVTVVEMLTGYPIYHTAPPMLFVSLLMSPGPIDTGIADLPPELHYFFKLTFTKSAKNRPKCRDLLRCKFITQT